MLLHRREAHAAVHGRPGAQGARIHLQMASGTLTDRSRDFVLLDGRGA